MIPGFGAAARRAAGSRRATPLPSKVKRPAAQSPGTKYTHYAPSRPLILFLRRILSSLLREAPSRSARTCPTRLSPFFPKQKFLSLGSSPEEIARNLFAALRTRRRGTELLALAIPRRGVGRAVMDRLTRAATRIVR